MNCSSKWQWYLNWEFPQINHLQGNQLHPQVSKEWNWIYKFSSIAIDESIFFQFGRNSSSENSCLHKLKKITKPWRKLARLIRLPDSLRLKTNWVWWSKFKIKTDQASARTSRGWYGLRFVVYMYMKSASTENYNQDTFRCMNVLWYLAA